MTVATRGPRHRESSSVRAPDCCTVYVVPSRSAGGMGVLVQAASPRQRSPPTRLIVLLIFAMLTLEAQGCWQLPVRLVTAPAGGEGHLSLAGTAIPA